MTTTILKNEISKALSDIHDKTFLEGLYTIINAHAERLDYELSEEDLKLIESRRKLFKSGKAKEIGMNEMRKRISKKLSA